MPPSKKSSTYLIISDIHADIKALNSIIEIIGDSNFKNKYGTVNKILNLGDTVGRGYHPAKVIERLMELKNEVMIISIMGNHDESFLYNWPVSGDDEDSIEIHKKLKSGSSSFKSQMTTQMDFLKNLPQHFIDYENNIFAVHGGPIDPDKITPQGLKGYDKWLYQQTWQRISENKSEYKDNYGYHYIPDNAFRSVREFLNKNFIIFCGHQHVEAAYRNIGMKTEDIMQSFMKEKVYNFAGYNVKIKEFEREQNIDYLIRVGIAGPVGYNKKNRWNKIHFGLLWEEKRKQKIGLFEIELEY